MSAVLKLIRYVNIRIRCFFSAYLFCLVGVVNSLRISFAISVFWLVSLFNKPIAATAVWAAVCVRFNGEPVAVYVHISLKDAVGAFDEGIFIGEISDGGAGDDDRRSLIFAVLIESWLIPFNVVGIKGFVTGVFRNGDWWRRLCVVSFLGDVREDIWWGCWISVGLFGIIWDRGWVWGGRIVGGWWTGW